MFLRACCVLAQGLPISPREAPKECSSAESSQSGQQQTASGPPGQQTSDTGSQGISTGCTAEADELQLPKHLSVELQVVEDKPGALSVKVIISISSEQRPGFCPLTVRPATSTVPEADVEAVDAEQVVEATHDPPGPYSSNASNKQQLMDSCRPVSGTAAGAASTAAVQAQSAAHAGPTPALAGGHAIAPEQSDVRVSGELCVWQRVLLASRLQQLLAVSEAEANAAAGAAADPAPEDVSTGSVPPAEPCMEQQNLQGSQDAQTTEQQGLHGHASSQSGISHAEWLRQLHQESLEAEAARAAAAVAATESHRKASMRSWGGRGTSSAPGLKLSPPGSYSANSSARASSTGAAGAPSQSAPAAAAAASLLMGPARPGYSSGRRASLPGAILAGSNSSSGRVSAGYSTSAPRRSRVSVGASGYRASFSGSMVDPEAGARGYGSSAGAAAGKAHKTAITDKLLVQLGQAAAMMLSAQHEQQGEQHPVQERLASSASTGALDVPSTSAHGSLQEASTNSLRPHASTSSICAHASTRTPAVVSTTAAHSRLSCTSSMPLLPGITSRRSSIGLHSISTGLQNRILKEGEVLTAAQRANLLRKVSAALAAGISLDELVQHCEGSGYTASAADRRALLHQQLHQHSQHAPTAQQQQQQYRHQYRRYSMQAGGSNVDGKLGSGQLQLRAGRLTWAGPSLDPLEELPAAQQQQQHPQEQKQEQQLQEPKWQQGDVEGYAIPEVPGGSHAAGLLLTQAAAATPAAAQGPEATALPTQEPAVEEGAATAVAVSVDAQEEEEQFALQHLAMHLPQQLSSPGRPSSPGIGSCKLSNPSSFDGYPYLAAQLSNSGLLSANHSHSLLFTLPEQEYSGGAGSVGEDCSLVTLHFPWPAAAVGVAAGAGSGNDEGVSGARRSSNASDSSCSSFLGRSRSASPRCGCGSFSGEASVIMPAGAESSLSIVGRVRASTSGGAAAAVATACALRPASSGPLLVHENYPILLTSSQGPAEWALLSQQLGQVLEGDDSAGASSSCPRQEDLELSQAGLEPMTFLSSRDTSASSIGEHQEVGTAAESSSAACAAELPAPAASTDATAAYDFAAARSSESPKAATWGGSTDSTSCVFASGSGSTVAVRDPSRVAARRGTAGQKTYSSCAGTSDTVVTHRVLTYENVTTVVWRDREGAVDGSSPAAAAAADAPAPADMAAVGTQEACLQMQGMSALPAMDSILEEECPADGKGCAGLQDDITETTEPAVAAAATEAAEAAAQEDSIAATVVASPSPYTQLTVDVDSSSGDSNPKEQAQTNSDEHQPPASLTENSTTSALTQQQQQQQQQQGSKLSTCSSPRSPKVPTSPLGPRRVRQPFSPAFGSSAPRTVGSSSSSGSRDTATGIAASSGSKSVPASPTSGRRAAAINTTPAPSSPGKAPSAFGRSLSSGSSCSSSHTRQSGSKLLLAAAASRPGSPLKKLLVAAASAATGSGAGHSSELPSIGTSPCIGPTGGSKASSSNAVRPVADSRAGSPAAATTPAGCNGSPNSRTGGAVSSPKAKAAAAGESTRQMSTQAAHPKGPRRNSPRSVPSPQSSKTNKLPSSKSESPIQGTLSVELPTSPRIAAVHAAVVSSSSSSRGIAAAAASYSAGTRKTSAAAESGTVSAGISPQSSVTSLPSPRSTASTGTLLSPRSTSSSLHSSSYSSLQGNSRKAVSAFGRTLTQPAQLKSPGRVESQLLQPPKRRTSAQMLLLLQEQQATGPADADVCSDTEVEQADAPSGVDSNPQTQEQAQELPTAFDAQTATDAATGTPVTLRSSSSNRQLQLQRLREVRQRQRSSAGGTGPSTPSASTCASLAASASSSVSASVTAEQVDALLEHTDPQHSVAACTPAETVETNIKAEALPAMARASAPEMGFVHAAASAEAVDGGDKQDEAGHANACSFELSTAECSAAEPCKAELSTTQRALAEPSTAEPILADQSQAAEEPSQCGLEVSDEASSCSVQWAAFTMFVAPDPGPRHIKGAPSSGSERDELLPAAATAEADASADAGMVEVLAVLRSGGEQCPGDEAAAGPEVAEAPCTVSSGVSLEGTDLCEQLATGAVGDTGAQPAAMAAEVEPEATAEVAAEATTAAPDACVVDGAPAALPCGVTDRDSEQGQQAAAAAAAATEEADAAGAEPEAGTNESMANGVLTEGSEQGMAKAKVGAGAEAEEGKRAATAAAAAAAAADATAAVGPALIEAGVDGPAPAELAGADAAGPAAPGAEHLVADIDAAAGAGASVHPATVSEQVAAAIDVTAVAVAAAASFDDCLAASTAATAVADTGLCCSDVTAEQPPAASNAAVQVGSSEASSANSAAAEASDVSLDATAVAEKLPAAQSDAGDLDAEACAAQPAAAEHGGVSLAAAAEELPSAICDTPGVGAEACAADTAAEESGDVSSDALAEQPPAADEVTADMETETCSIGAAAEEPSEVSSDGNAEQLPAADLLADKEEVGAEACQTRPTAVEQSTQISSDRTAEELPATAAAAAAEPSSVTSDHVPEQPPAADNVTNAGCADDAAAVVAAEQSKVSNSSEAVAEQPPSAADTTCVAGADDSTAAAAAEHSGININSIIGQQPSVDDVIIVAGADDCTAAASEHSSASISSDAACELSEGAAGDAAASAVDDDSAAAPEHTPMDAADERPSAAGTVTATDAAADCPAAAEAAAAAVEMDGSGDSGSGSAAKEEPPVATAAEDCTAAGAAAVNEPPIVAAERAEGDYTDAGSAAAPFAAAAAAGGACGVGVVSFALSGLQEEPSTTSTVLSAYHPAATAAAAAAAAAAAGGGGGGEGPQSYQLTEMHSFQSVGTWIAPDGPISHPLGSMPSVLGSEYSLYSMDSLASVMSAMSGANMPGASFSGGAANLTAVNLSAVNALSGAAVHSGGGASQHGQRSPRGGLLVEESSLASAGGRVGPPARHRLSASSISGFWYPPPPQQQQQQQQVLPWQGSVQLEATETINENAEGEEEKEGVEPATAAAAAAAEAVTVADTQASSNVTAVETVEASSSHQAEAEPLLTEQAEAATATGTMAKAEDEPLMHPVPKLKLPIDSQLGDRVGTSPNSQLLPEDVHTNLEPRLGGMLLSIPSPTAELHCIDGASAGSSGGGGGGGSSGSGSSNWVSATSGCKPRQLLSCPAGPAVMRSDGGSGGLGLQLRSGLLLPGELGASRFASSGSAGGWEGISTGAAARLLHTTPAAGTTPASQGGSAAAGAVADGLTGILALVQQLQGNLAGLESDMQQLHGALHRRSATADASMLRRHHHHAQQ